MGGISQYAWWADLEFQRQNIVQIANGQCKDKCCSLVLYFFTKSSGIQLSLAYDKWLIIIKSCTGNIKIYTLAEISISCCRAVKIRRGFFYHDTFWLYILSTNVTPILITLKLKFFGTKSDKQIKCYKRTKFAKNVTNKLDIYGWSCQQLFKREDVRCQATWQSSCDRLTDEPNLLNLILENVNVV